MTMPLTIARLLPTLALLVLPSPLLADDDAPEPAPHSASGATALKARPNGHSLLISAEQQKQSGLKTRILEARLLQAELPAYGRIMDIQPLLELRARFRSAQSELTIAEAALQLSRKNHDRLARLHAESIIATRELIQVQSQRASDQARREAARRHMWEVREEALQTWGGTWFHQAVEAESPLFESLLNHTQVLALIALPAGQTLPDNLRTLRIAPGGEPQRARQARLISPAPKTEETTQGETWFAIAESAGLRTGMRLDARIPQGGLVATGVAIPLSAVVWHDGLPWVFVKTAENRFSRRLIAAHRDQGESWFVSEGFSPGEETVIVGAPMLLSEERRHPSLLEED
ncbi:MAG: hypothetical protein PHE55_03020 [Methylococcaceae bacterium]|nr:hypothetical protein [Methylococcaceae bacterium]